MLGSYLVLLLSAAAGPPTLRMKREIKAWATRQSKFGLHGASMPDKDEKARRKQMLHAVRDDARQKVRDTPSRCSSGVKALFNYVDSRLDSVECDHTLRHARDFIRSRELPEDGVVTGSKIMAVIVTVRQ